MKQTFFFVVPVLFVYVVGQKKNDFRSYCVIFLGQVLCRDGKAVELSAKLTPGNASERARIEAAGGWITEERFVCSTDLHVMAGLQNMLISYC